MIKKCFVFILTLFIACNAPKNRIAVLCTDTAAIHNASKLSWEELYTLKKVDRRTVNIDGILSYNFEDIALYPDKSNPDSKGVWLDLDDKFLHSDSLLRKLNGKEVSIIGTVDLTRKGHLNSYFCTLLNIVCIREEQ